MRWMQVADKRGLSYSQETDGSSEKWDSSGNDEVD